MGASRNSWPLTVLAAVAIVGVVALGTVLRLADPLSTKVIPAEDPYNHMALVREDLRTGAIDPLNPGGTLYPPGLHAFLAAAWAFSGADLNEIVRFGPVVFGAISVLAVAIVLWRLAGPVAGFVGALGMAVAPELIFRTTMMSPTALDLALLPILAYALVRLAMGRLAWAGVAAPLALFLVFAHPWLLAILALTGAAFAVFWAILPWPHVHGKPLSARGLSLALAVLGGSMSLTMSTCGGTCGPGFQDITDIGPSLEWTGFVGLLVVAAVAALVWWKSSTVDRLLQARADHQPAWWASLAASVALAVTLFAVTSAATRAGLPPLVDLPRMLGWPLLVIGALAFVALPFIRSPGAHVAAALAAVTFPLVVFNPLHSEFLPHRTVAFLGLGLCLLVGAGAGAAFRWAQAALAAAPALRRRSAGAAARPSRGLLVLIPALFVGLALGVPVYASTPDDYPGGWYRLYNECETSGFQDIAATVDADPDGIVITGDWQAKLVLAAFADNSTRVWNKPEAFHVDDAQMQFLESSARTNHAVYVIVDRYLLPEQPYADTSFLSQAPWHPVGSWCMGMGLAEPRLLAYVQEPGRP